MAGETGAWQSDSLRQIAAELRRQANNLRSLKDEMDGTVVPNTMRWTGSGSVPAALYEGARVAIDGEIEEVSRLADLFAGITDHHNDLNLDTERRASQIVGPA